MNSSKTFLEALSTCGVIHDTTGEKEAPRGVNQWGLEGRACDSIRGIDNNVNQGVALQQAIRRRSVKGTKAT